MAAVYAHASRKFAGLAEVLRTPGPRTQGLREALADYEELCTWLAAQDRPEQRPAELDQVRELLRELETEIRTLRQEH